MAKTSKENFAKCTRVASFSGDLTDSTIIQVNMGEVTKVQADSSNTQTTIDAGESLETLTIDNSEDRESLASAFRPLGTDLMMSSGSRNDDSNKKKLNICQPVVSSGVGNTKINHEKCGMVVLVLFDEAGCIKGNEAKETKVEADSSKTERRTDAGKSLPAFTVDDSEIRLRSSLTRNSRTPSIISLRVTDDDDTEFLSPSGLYEQEFLKGSSSSLRSDDDSKKPKLSIYHQVATSSVEKSKKNFKMCRMDAPILNDLTDGQIKGSEAKESKVQSDSSKPQTTADAGESLPTSVKSREVNLTKSQFNEMRVEAHFSKAKTSKEIFAKWARVASFSGDLTDSTIIQVNMGEVMKVQADSSNTQTTIENLDEEVEHPGEVLNIRREFSGDADCGCSTVDGTSNRVRKPTSTLQVEFGWIHYRKGKFSQVKGTEGRTRKADMERSATYQDCLFKAIELFYPNSISRYGTLAEMETPYLANFKLHKCNEEGFTVERFKEETKRNLPRIYLVTKPKTQTDSRPQRNSPSSDTLYGTEVNKVESSTYSPASEADSGFQDLLSDMSSDLDSMLQFLEDPNVSLMSNVDGQSPMEVTESTVQQGQVGTNRNGNSHTEDISLTAADLNTILPEITQDYYLDHSGSVDTLASIVSSACMSTSAKTSNSLTRSEFSQSGKDRQDEEFPPQDSSTPWQVVNLQPGSYCVYRYSPLQREERSFEWDPKPSKGIISQKGWSVCQRTTESFFQDPEKFIQKMDTASDLCKERREQFILLEILPHLEESWGRCSELNKHVYKHLAKLSHSVSGGQVVRHSLQLLLHLICKDNFERGHGSLLELEGIMRSSIFSDKGVFRKDGQCERTLKLFVYSRILSLLLKPDVLQDELLVAEMENDLKRIVEELQRHQKQVKCKKKDTLRYSIEFTIMLFSHSCLLKPSKSLPTDGRRETFLVECEEFCVNPRKESKDLTLLKRLRKKKKNLSWAELHSILYHLHGKVHSERPNPKMDTERRALILIRLIVEAFLSGGGGEDWRFCLAASLLLVEIAKNNITKVMRQEAALTLVYLLRDKKVQDRPECRALLEKRASELLFSSDPEIRKIMIHFLSHNQEEAVALPAERHKEHLSSTYKTQTLEINNTIISHSAECFISTGMFQRKKVAVKVLNVKKNHLLADNPDFEARRRLINEADNMRRLSESQLPNFPVLLGFDTINMPFHIITAFEKWGNLRQFLQLRRDKEPYVQPVELLKMLVGICRALLHIDALGLVHRCVNAENILVGDNFECKLSGLHSLRPLTFEQRDQDSLYEGYTPLEIPQYIGKPTDDDLPVRWQAPECLMNHRFSTASDVWAFGVVMYEVLTYGCTPYRHLLEEEEVSHQVIDLKEIVPHESCLENREYELIKKCCKWECAHRPRFTDIMNQLDQIIQNSDKGKPRPGPPPLEVDIKAGGSLIAPDGEAVYNTIADILKDVNLDSTEKDDNMQSDIYDDLVADYFITENQGSIWTWERLSQQDVQHATELRCLNHPNIVPIWKQDFFNSFRWIASHPNYPNGNLKEYVLQRQCKKESIEMFLSQVASACHYLHNKHIVHGALRAEYVNVVSPNQVQIGRLGRSKSLSVSADEVTSTSCVAQAAMPLDASRWSAPEVILDGYYSHASDVWAFGILAWELYASYQYGQEEQQFSRPYHWLENDEILPYQRDNGPLSRLKCCPDWVYNLMHQCWAFDSKQRPPFLAIFDCLTSREPMKSWIMVHWLKRHFFEKEWPDLSVSQRIDAPHVLGEDSHPSERNIERMCCDEYYDQHHYKYVKMSDVYAPNERLEKSVNALDNLLYSRVVCEARVSDYLCSETVIMCPYKTGNQENGLDFEKWIKENKNAVYANESSSILEDTESQRTGEAANNRASPLKRKNTMRKSNLQKFKYKMKDEREESPLQAQQ